MTPPRVVWALAAASLGVVAALSYTVQRVVDAVREPAPTGAILAQAHIPYYWRCDLALFHGGLVAVLVLLAVDPPTASRWLGRAWLVPAIVLPCIVAMVAVP